MEAPEYLDLDEIDFSDDSVVSLTIEEREVDDAKHSNVQKRHRNKDVQNPTNAEEKCCEFTRGLCSH